MPRSGWVLDLLEAAGKNIRHNSGRNLVTWQIGLSVDHVTLWPTCTFESHKDHGVFVPLVLMQLRSNF